MGTIRGVLGDVEGEALPAGTVYCHEHFIIDSPLIESAFPHIHLHDVEAAVAEIDACVAAGAVLFVDAMPIASGRDGVRLAEIARRTGTVVLSATGLHHDRYYGPLHWSNHVAADALTRLFIADLEQGIDRFDYTGPIIERTEHRAGFVKVATSGPKPDARDRRNIEAVAAASVETGAPVLTHCEGGLGGLEQVEALVDAGVPSTSIILSHVDKTGDLGYLIALAETGCTLELDQTLRQADAGVDSISVRAVVALAEAHRLDQVVVGTDGARRGLWTSLGGAPGLAWLASDFPLLLADAGLNQTQIKTIMRDNALRALSWRQPGARA